MQRFRRQDRCAGTANTRVQPMHRSIWQYLYLPLRLRTVVEGVSRLAVRAGAVLRGRRRIFAARALHRRSPLGTTHAPYKRINISQSHTHIL